MTIIKRFCFCCSLRGGSMFVASYSLLSSAFFIALLLIRNIGYRIVESSIIHRVVTYGLFVFFGMVMVMAIVLIIAVHKNKRTLFLPWIIFTIVCHIFATITVVWLVTLTLRDDDTPSQALEGWEIGLLCYHAVNIIISTYCVICVFSHYQEIGSGTPTTSTTPSEYRRDLTLIFRERTRSGLNNPALNAETARPPGVMVTPPPYNEGAAPPPYTTFPRGAPSTLERDNSGRRGAGRGAGERAGAGVGAGRIVEPLVEEDEDNIDENLVGDMPPTEVAQVESDDEQPPLPPRTPPEERSTTPPPHPPPPPPTESQDNSRRYRNPPTYRRILPDTQLGQMMAEQQRLARETEESAENTEHIAEDHPHRRQEGDDRPVHQDPPTSSDEENTESELSTESDELASTPNHGSDVGEADRKETVDDGPAPDLPGTAFPDVDQGTSSSTPTSNRDSPVEAAIEFDKESDTADSVDEGGLADVIDQTEHDQDNTKGTQDIKGRPIEVSSSNEQRNSASMEGSILPTSSFQGELTQALLKRQKPNEQSAAKSGIPEAKDTKPSSNLNKKDTRPLSPREIRPFAPTAKKFATVSSSSRKIMDTTLQKINKKQFKKPGNVDSKKDLVPVKEREHKPHRTTQDEERHEQDRNHYDDHNRRMNQSEDQRHHAAEDKYRKGYPGESRLRQSNPRDNKGRQDQDMDDWDKANYRDRSRDPYERDHRRSPPYDGENRERAYKEHENDDRRRQKDYRYDRRDPRDRYHERPRSGYYSGERSSGTSSGERLSDERPRERSYDDRDYSPVRHSYDYRRPRDNAGHEREQVDPIRLKRESSSSSDYNQPPKGDRHRMAPLPDEKYRHYEEDVYKKDRYHQEGSRDRGRDRTKEGDRERMYNERYRDHSPQKRIESQPRRYSPVRDPYRRSPPPRDDIHQQYRSSGDSFQEEPSAFDKRYRRDKLPAVMPGERRNSRSPENRGRTEGVYDILPQHKKGQYTREHPGPSREGIDRHQTETRENMRGGNGGRGEREERRYYERGIDERQRKGAGGNEKRYLSD